MKKKLIGIYRFINLRPQYIYHTRTFLEREHGFQLRKLLENQADAETRRDYLARNPHIKGIGYKEASHFLRNIGYKDYSILDKHILQCLYELKVIPRMERPSTPKKYVATEERMKAFCEKTRINLDEMDLLLWSLKTGEILK